MPSFTERKTGIPFILRWGIIGCGGISSSFVRDLALPTAERNVFDVVHSITACGSRSLFKAEEFINRYCPDGACAQKEGFIKTRPVAKGNYNEVYNNEDVDVIYIGTPHTCHYEDAKAALEAGKHVLLEKPATLNKAEFSALADFAQSKQLFLMEAVWTRFFPLTFALQEVLFKEEAIGDIKRVTSDFSMNFISSVPDTHRVLNPLLAGGGLLDLGPYPLVWAMMILFHHPNNELTQPTNINGSMFKDPKTGIDLFTDFTLDFPKLGARAVLSTSISVNSSKECVTRIQGTRGEVIMPWVTARPEKFIIRRSKVGRGPQEYVEEIKEFPIQGMGYYWEADAVARCIRDGKTESERMPIKETLMTMGILDEVRRLGGYLYQEGLEKIPAST